MRSSTYWETCTRISKPVEGYHDNQMAMPMEIWNDGPNIRVSGNRGAREISKPPKPQPTSANSGTLPERANEGNGYPNRHPGGEVGYSRAWSENGFA